MSVPVGIPGPWLQPSEYGRTEVGQFATVPYEDVDPNKINALAAQFDQLGYRYRVTHGFGKHRLEVYLSYNNNAVETPVDLWEYFSNSVSSDLTKSKLPSGLTDNIPTAFLDAVRRVINGQQPVPGSTYTTQISPTDPNYWAGAFVNFFPGIGPTDPRVVGATALYNIMSSGADSIIISAPVLRHTQSVSGQYSLSVNTDNVGRIISTVTLLTPPTTIPARISDNFPEDTNPANSTKKYGWKKEFPSIQQIANQKFQGIEEFTYGLWETQIYSTVL